MASRHGRMGNGPMGAVPSVHGAESALGAHGCRFLKFLGRERRETTKRVDLHFDVSTSFDADLSGRR